MKAKEYLLTGDAVTGEEAGKDRPDQPCRGRGSVEPPSIRLAQRLANGASKAIQWTKQSINIQLKHAAQCGPGCVDGARSALQSH